MFGKNKKSETKEQNVAQHAANASYCRVPQIYVMPPTFLSAAAQNVRLKKKKKKERKRLKEKSKSPTHKSTKKRLIHPAILALIILIVGVLGTAVVYLLTNKQKPPIIVVNTNILPKNINQPPLPPKNTNITPPQLVCGDSKASSSIGEECDDGNTKSGDGCSSRCKIETPPELPIINFTSYATTVDTDEDFLTDIEEQLYGTGVNNMDEDGDTYLDGLELINLYSPKSNSLAKIEDSDLVNILNNQEQGYSIFYPKGWKARYLNKDKSEVYFESTTVEFVEVLVTDNPRQESITTWAKKQFPDIEVSKLERVGVGDKLGIKSPNGLTVNFSYEDKIYSLTYQISTLRKLNFKATFQMMYNSLKLYSRGGTEEPPAEQWSSYINNQLGIKLQHPVNLEVTVGENNLVKIDDFNLIFIDNSEALELNEWFWQNNDKENNKDCQLGNSELKIGKLETFLIDKPIGSENDEICEDNGYYAISDDKKKIIKLSIGNNPAREMAQILSSLQLLTLESVIGD